MTPIVLTDAAMRMLSIGQLLLIALVIGRGRAPLKVRFATGWLLAGVAAYLTIATPVFRPTEGLSFALLQLCAQSMPVAFWIFAHLLFEREIDRRAVALSAVALMGCWIGYRFDEHRFTTMLFQRGVSLLLIIQAIVIALRERGDDLIEKRRRLRVGFLIVVGGLAFVVIVSELLLRPYRSSQLMIGQTLAILIATSAMGVALLQSDPELLSDPRQAVPEPPLLSPSEHVLNRKVSEAMAAAVYREPGLTIGRLADRLGVPEHRLRSLINQRLGYRNFSAFLNHHRVAEARRLLADPAQVDLPILTIAMDLGYGSLAPFNRAFRDNAGQSPSDFRRAAILQN